MPARPSASFGRQVDPPQRPRAVERLGQRPVAQGREAARVGTLVGVAEQRHVAVDVEALVVDPERLPHPRRAGREPPAKPRRVSSSRASTLRRRPSSAQRAAGPRGGSSKRAPRHVHVGVRGLDTQEGAVEGGEALGHGPSVSRRRPAVIGPAVGSNPGCSRRSNDLLGAMTPRTPPRRGSPPPVKLARRRVARHGLHAAEVEVALVASGAAASPPPPATRAPPGRRPARRPPGRPRRAGGARRPPPGRARPPSITPATVCTIAERIRFDPAEPSAISGRPSRSTTVGAIMLGTRAPGGWRWKPCGLRSSSPSMLLRCMPVPGTTTPEHGAVRAGDRGAGAVGVHHGEVRGGAQPRGDVARHLVEHVLGRKRSAKSLLVRPSRNSSSRARLVEAITSASARVSPGSVDPLEQLQRVGDQDPARRGRRVGEHLPAAEARPRGARARPPRRPPGPRG